MSVDDTWFAIALNVPALVLLAVALVGGVPADWARGAMVAYSSLLTMLFSSRIGGGVDSALPVLAGLLVAFAAAAVSGPAGLVLSALSLAVLAGSAWMIGDATGALGAALAAAILVIVMLVGAWRARRA